MTSIFPQCLSCKNYIEKKDKKDPFRCKAFELEIPNIILTNEHDHKEPFPGDNGIQFEGIGE
jgi:hypothetical protein